MIFIVDGTVENLAFLSVKHIALGIICQKELASRCTGGIHCLIKQHEVCYRAVINGRCHCL